MLLGLICLMKKKLLFYFYIIFSSKKREINFLIGVLRLLEYLLYYIYLIPTLSFVPHCGITFKVTVYYYVPNSCTFQNDESSTKESKIKGFWIKRFKKSIRISSKDSIPRSGRILHYTVSFTELFSLKERILGTSLYQGVSYSPLVTSMMRYELVIFLHLEVRNEAVLSSRLAQTDLDVVGRASVRCECVLDCQWSMCLFCRI